MRKEQPFLWNQAYAAKPRGSFTQAAPRVPSFALEAQPTGLRLDEPRSHADKRTLATSRGSNDTEDATGHGQIYVQHEVASLHSRYQVNERFCHGLSRQARGRPKSRSAIRSAPSPRPTATPAQKSASPSRPAACLASMASASVCVCPGMFPAIMTVAPYSPTLRRNASIAAAIRPRLANGKVTVKKRRIGE